MNNNNNTAIMVPIPPSQTSRKNRRRERPGARKRHALALAHEVAEGMDMAGDFTLALPLRHSHSHAQSLQQHHYDRSWKAWKAKEAAAEEMKRERDSVDKVEKARQQEKEAYTRLFGGEADDDQPREFTISYASIKKNRKPNRITKPRVTPTVRMRTRRPALGFAMSLPLRPANTAQIEQRQLPVFTAGSTPLSTIKTTTPQSLPTTSDRGTLWNSSSFSIPIRGVSTSNTTPQQQRRTSETGLSREEERKRKIRSLRGDDL